jgi:hypothetical protein
MFSVAQGIDLSEEILFFGERFSLLSALGS